MYCVRQMGNAFLKKKYSFMKPQLRKNPVFINYNLQLMVQRYHKFQNVDQSVKKFQHSNKIFYIIVTASSIGFAYMLQKKNNEHIISKLHDAKPVEVEKGLFNAPVSFYEYRGYVFPYEMLYPAILKDLKNFEFQDSDVVVASFPKAGTTWVQEIVYMLHHNCQESDLSSELLENRFPYLEYPFPGIKDLKARKGKRFIKTHLPYDFISEPLKKSKAKLIYITRNPRDVVVSYWYFMKLLVKTDFIGTFWDFQKFFTSDDVPYGPFFSHVESYLKEKENPNILILSYEELQANPIEMINKIAQFYQIPVTAAQVAKVAEATSFSHMSGNPSVNYEHLKDYGFAFYTGKFLRKGTIGDWKNHFTPSILQNFEEWETEKNKLNIKFRYE